MGAREAAARATWAEPGTHKPMFSAIDSLLAAARLAPALDSAPDLARSMVAPAQALADLKQLGPAPLESD